MTFSFIQALNRQPTNKRPIWIMRQAGRYLPEYLEIRKQAKHFMDFCKNPKLTCEATMQPLRRFDLDAAILFSDILTIPDAMNIGLEFVAGEGPVIRQPVRSVDAVNALPDVNIEQLDYVFETVDRIKTSLKGSHPLIGFAGSPWTVASYMVEGGSSKLFFEIRKMLYNEPKALHLLLNKLSEITIAYLTKQIEAGVDAVMLFDTWGGILSPEHYEQFSLAYMQKIIAALPDVPTILFTKNGGQHLEKMAATGCNALGLDWTCNISDAKKRVGDRVALQGNLDPAVLLSNPNAVKEAVNKVLTDCGDRTGHIFNLGHGIDKATPIENVEAMIKAVREFDN